MRTLTLEIDESVYEKFINFVHSLPEQQCHVIAEQSFGIAETKPVLTISSSFGLVKTPISASLNDIQQGIDEGFARDCY